MNEDTPAEEASDDTGVPAPSASPPPPAPGTTPGGYSYTVVDDAVPTPPPALKRDRHIGRKRRGGEEGHRTRNDNRSDSTHRLRPLIPYGQTKMQPHF